MNDDHSDVKPLNVNKLGIPISGIIMSICGFLLFRVGIVEDHFFFITVGFVFLFCGLFLFFSVAILVFPPFGIYFEIVFAFSKSEKRRTDLF